MLSIAKLRVGAEAYYLVLVAAGIDEHVIAPPNCAGRRRGASQGAVGSAMNDRPEFRFVGPVVQIARPVVQVLGVDGSGLRSSAGDQKKVGNLNFQGSRHEVQRYVPPSFWRSISPARRPGVQTRRTTDREVLVLMERLTYSVNEVAGLLGLSRSKIYELVASGAIPALPIPGRRKLVARATLLRLVDEALVVADSPTTFHDDPGDDDHSDTRQRRLTRPLPAPRSQPGHSPVTDAPGILGASRRARGG
jgi:excisionase family DNA binding protein